MKEGKVSEIGTYDELMANKGAFSEFILEQISQDNESEYSSMSEAELELVTKQLNQTLGPEELEKRLKEHKRKRKRSTRVKTTSIGSIGDYQEEVLSEAESGISSIRPKLERGISAISGGSLAKQMVTIDQSKKEAFKAGVDLIEEETAETDRVKFGIYVYYAKNIGASLALGSMVLYACFQGFTVGANVWLSIWSEDKEASTDIAVRNKYLAVYGVLGICQSFAILSGVILVTLGTLRAATRLHRQMLDHILMSTMAFFDTTPIGRIVNRFSKDIDEVDLMIPTHLKDILSDLFSVIGTVIVICYVSPILIVLIIPMIGLFFFIQNSYLALSRYWNYHVKLMYSILLKNIDKNRQLKRMVSVTRSPINSSLTESFSGASTIRAFGVTEQFIERNDGRIEANQVRQ